MTTQNTPNKTVDIIYLILSFGIPLINRWIKNRKKRKQEIKECDKKCDCKFECLKLKHESI